MSDIVISVAGLAKSYLVGHQAATAKRYTALRDVIARNARALARKTTDMLHGRPIVQGDEVEEFWALQDVSFEVEQGEVLGIIGRNGAGKSTLLKVLSRITEPTQGRVKIAGRVASLLEVGTGFHPELTGRENIFLNGAILGMTRAEIKNKFDEIVAFAETEKFLDTPVKRYSSGMYVRLAFAVAAHLEPEILIIDEVLAVGDANFQKKCLGKMGNVVQEGRTVLFVSHNMDAIARLCPRSLFLASGRNVFDGDSREAIASYLNSSKKDEAGPVDLTQHNGRNHKMKIIATKIGLRTERSGSEYVNSVFTGDSLILDISFDCKDYKLDLIQVGISSLQGQRVFTVSTHHDPKFNHAISGKGVIVCHLPSVPLTSGDYTVTVMMGKRIPPHNIDYIEDAMTFHVDFGDYFGTGTAPFKGQGHFAQISSWAVGEEGNYND